jgi:cysteinyl-tRNA synthetase
MVLCLEVLIMSLKIYNSLTNKIEEFIPNNKDEVNMYVCGPTVYNYIHIGNARPVIFYDMLRRYLEYLGYKVNYASNITDVDDKIINKAIEENLSEKEIAKRYEDAFFNDSMRLGSRRPTFVPHATEYIDNMISFIKGLEDKGYAYENDGDVYFRVNKLKEYGELSNQQRDELENGVRIDVSDKKESPLDFNLWKKTFKGIQWDSPFGKGRPGWHTECVCMIDKIFKGQMIDIHGGGMDLKFPHHENEMAQARAMYNHNLAKYWVHVGRLDLQGEKMSKSLGNVIFVKDIKDADDLMSFRLLIVASPYRNVINYSTDLFNQYKKEYLKIKKAYKDGMRKLDLEEIEFSGVIQSDKDEFISSMDNDFNCQNAIALIDRLVKEINLSIRSNENELLSKKVLMLKEITDVFGLDLKYEKLDLESKTLLNKWNELKKEKKFDEADKLRLELTNKGII